MFITGKIVRYVGTGILSKFFNLRFFEKKNVLIFFSLSYCGLWKVRFFHILFNLK
jgi:hypothetical protein